MKNSNVDKTTNDAKITANFHAKFERANNKNYFVGIDIGGTKIIICLVDLQGNVVNRQKTKTTNDIDEIRALIEDFLKASSVSTEQVQSLGFGIPGVTDSDKGVIIETPAFDWDRFPFREYMQKYFDQPIFINNDVNCAAIGEKWIGEAQGLDDFVFIAVGTGVGSAIFANGELIQGDKFMAGEIAYWVINEDIHQDQLNSFCKEGVFEQRTSGSALAGYGYDPKELFNRYMDGKDDALKIIEHFINDLSVAIANAVSLLNPNKIIIGGGVSQSLQLVLDSVQSTVSRITPVPAEIELSKLGENAGAIGAAGFALQQFHFMKGGIKE